MRKGRANIDDGLFQIELQLELPEVMKPRRIDIKSGKPLPMTIKPLPRTITSEPFARKRELGSRKYADPPSFVNYSAA
jgi:hypothetical protein